MTTTARSRQDAPADRVMAALSRHVPLTLLCDLADPVGPASSGIYVAELRDGVATGAAPPHDGGRPDGCTADSTAVA